MFWKNVDSQPSKNMRRRRRHAAVALAAGFVTITAAATAKTDDALEARLAQGADLSWGPQVAAVWPAVRAFYAARGHAPLWLDDGRPTNRARQAAAVLRAAEADGLEPAHYEAERLAARIDGRGDEPAALELAVTGELLHFLAELRYGRFARPALAQADTHLAPGGLDAGEVLVRLARADDLAAVVRGMAPANTPYRALRRVLAHYREDAAAGGWPVVPEGATLKPGMVDPRVPALRRRLAATGDLVVGDGTADGTLYDPVLVDSVDRFQRRHGLEPDGVVGRNTRAELNVTAEDRVSQVALNMERWRWMADDLGDRYVFVNLAGFELDVVEHGATVMAMRVVVGRPYRRTPMFTGEMTYLEFSPTWTVPPTILKQDLLPQLRKDPAYLAQKGIEVFSGWGPEARRLDPTTIDWHDGMARLMSYRYVQPPGPKNALGRVKFMFPNPYSIYLHDTPERELFARASRAFSSGCIRVQRPAELAGYLLADQESWTRESIERAMAGSVPTRAKLSRTLPVHLVYATAWVGEGGTVEFRGDVYGRDATLRESISAAAGGH